MAIISMIPSDGSVVIDGAAALGVDFVGLNPEIHSIHWYGSSGQLEYVFNPATGVKPPNTDFTSLAPYQGYIDQAQAIIDAFENPDIYYATIDNYPWQGGFYPMGAEISVSTPNTPQPPNTTELQPPTLFSYQTLYWNGTWWVASPVNPFSTLSDAKEFLIKKVKESAASNSTTQSRIYSPLELVTSADPGALVCADYSSETLSSYQATQDSRVQGMITVINSASLVSEFYGFDPNVSPAP
jgi:hypothetical protein